MQLAIFGPGLIGGSIALAARQRGLCERLCLWSLDQDERALAGRLGLDAFITDDLGTAAASCDLAILCTPPAAMPALAEKLASHLPKRATLSDVASVKNGFAKALETIFGSQYVGAHPMAGGEVSGLAAARADLFEGAVCLVTPHPSSAASALENVEAFWRSLGAHTRQLPATEHDETVALISHLPHLTAAALVNFVAGENRDSISCAGPGWRDTTRVAGGPPELWTEILSHNRGAVTRALNGLIAKLREAGEFLEQGREADLGKFLAQARSSRGAAAAEEYKEGKMI